VTVHKHHKRLTALLLASLVATVGGALHRLEADETQTLPLPAWNDRDIILLSAEPEAIPLGGLLWPDGFGPDSILPPETVAPRIPPDALMADDASGLLAPRRKEGFLLFMPKPRPLHTGSQAQPAATPPQNLVDVGADLLRECEELEPEGCLLDPHALLAETQSEDLRRLLTYHAGEANTFANFFLLDADEQLPASADLSKLARGRLVQGHSCLVVYPLAEPWRARIFMTREIAAGVPAEYLRSILHACVQDAMRASDSVEQLQRFATQLSIRLIWMERAHPAIFTGSPEEIRHAEANAPVAPATLAEVAHTPVVAVEKSFDYLRWQPMAIAAGSALAALPLLFVLFRWFLRWRRRRLRNSVWLLPEVEVKPRFGAPHCGQGGVWIRYG
jgi:hypothetical protein